MNYSIEDLTGIAPLTAEELVAVEGGALTWAAVAGVALYIATLDTAWGFGEKIADHFWPV
jgi:lactobin A/cerein 7B family class IIb bacteriocin